MEGEQAVRLCNYTDVYKNASIAEGMDFMQATASREQIDKFRLAVGDTLLTKDSETADDIGVPAFVEYEAADLVCGYHLSIVRPDAFVADPKFLYWALAAQPTLGQWAVLASGVTRVGIKSGDLARVALALPPLGEQRAIAQYLDRETARIDTLIEEQQRLIEMLRERRVAAVERSIAMLDWTVPFKSVATLIQTGPFGSQLKSDEYEDGGTPIINPSHMVAGEIVPDPRVAVSAPKAQELGRHALMGGDLICARRGDLGRCAVVDESSAGYLCGTGSALVRVDPDRIDAPFAALVFSSRRNRDALALASVGSTMDNLNSDIIGALRIPLPTLAEQRELVATVNEQTTKIDELIAETERFIELSRERRAALITAAVTGQIDVREVA
ncbi:restriction endonuclease subunit S [Janibacter terrae]|uniref:restriction endonuclease subunit S n=1 Tax=Janibacter terrae TaxID=103817 RepID=UPI0008302D0D|nr:restriction endonuclease subunit S [Janibacter terrae]